MSSASSRTATIVRTTRETDIQLTLELDGRGEARIATQVPFLNHMLTLFAVHGFFNLTVEATGDTDVDYHHTVEDIGICLGQALHQALGDKGAIKRYGASAVPMDETLVRVTLDCSNRPYLLYKVTIRDQKVGDFDTALTLEFLRALTVHAGLTLHVELIHGENAHHIIEAIFKALARALDDATTPENRVVGVLSSKGAI